MQVIVSAPGKIHLMGEHAVVYGKPALLAAINLRLSVTIKPAKTGLTISSKEPTQYVSDAIKIVKEHLILARIPPMSVSVSSQIPAGYHLGSSAAVAVATIGATFYFLKKIWNPQLINQLAYEVEKKQHGNPSGGDNTAVTFGGFVWYRKELEFLKSMWQLPFKIPDTLNHFFLINTGRPKETTGEMVAYVSARYKVHSAKYERLFSQNEEQTKRVAVALKEGNEKGLIDAIQKGERTLERMGIVNDKVVPLIRSVEKAGGAAKILGGGGKMGSVGFLLCYHHEPTKVEKLCQLYGFSLQNIILGAEGVRLEKK